MKRTIFLLFLILGIFQSRVEFAIAQSGANEWSVVSPDGNIKVTVVYQTLTAPFAAEPRLYYRIDRAGQAVLELSPLGISQTIASAGFVSGLTFVSRADNSVNETYEVLSGKQKTVKNQANEMVLTFKNTANQNLELIIRAYNEGGAYRYRLMGSGSYNISQELSGFRIPAATKVWAQGWADYYEGEYFSQTFSQLETGEWGSPLLLQLANGNWVLIGEAAVYKPYAALHFKGSGSGSRLVNLIFPSDQTGPITGNLPLETPWRVVMAGTLKNIMESDIFKNLNPQSKIADTSWVKPGRVAWSWWGDPNSPKSLATQKQYVDFAAEMGWEYVLVDEGWSSSWVVELVNYAKAKNVSIILWAYAPGFTENQAAQWASWGVKGAKLDFFSSDNQETFQNLYDPFYEYTAKYKLIVNYHGTTVPTGEVRSWPHHLTREGVKGGEYINFPDKPPPDAVHNTTLPFTRNILGSMDYTPVAFSNLRHGTTYAHQLALSVVFESGLQHFVDKPDIYRASSGKDFLKAVPASWDETRFIEGFPGDFIVLARRKGNDWFIGAINTTSRTIQIPLNFLNSGSYQATIYKDGASSTQISVSSQAVTGASVLSISMSVNGGASVHIKSGSQASAHPSVSPCSKKGDVNGDCLVNQLDMKAILVAWGKSMLTYIRPEDIDQNSFVNTLDAAYVIAGWGK